MVGIAQKAGVRTGSRRHGLLILALTLAFTLGPGGSASPASASPGDSPSLSPTAIPPAPDAAGAPAGISIINGRRTKIGDWPWQVGLLGRKRARSRATPRSRFFCGGSLIAPDLVLTAAHCLVDFKKRGIRRIEVVSGRTHLNRESTGVVSAVERAIFPVNSNGKRRFREPGGVPSWDVALLKLKAPLTSATIKIAGPDEAAASRPGGPAFTTGWGVTDARNGRGSNALKFAKQVILPNRLCRSTTGRFYQSATMNCLGGPGAKTSTCFGDSGGPLVAAVGDGFRLVGLTSNGDPYCRANIPSVDARLADRPIRGWVRTKALAVSGVDVVGRGGTVAPAPRWCRVPNLRNLNLSRAGRLLRARNCRLGQKRTDRFSGLRRGRVSFGALMPGWLAPPGSRITVWVAK